MHYFWRLFFRINYSISQFDQKVAGLSGRTVPLSNLQPRKVYFLAQNPRTLWRATAPLSLSYLTRCER